MPIARDEYAARRKAQQCIRCRQHRKHPGAVSTDYAHPTGSALDEPVNISGASRIGASRPTW